MAIDGEFLAAQADRLAVVLRPPRRSLDTALVELAILLDGLCKTEAEAEQLTTALLAQQWPRSFDFALVSSLARKLKTPAARPKTGRELFLETGATETEADGLLEFGRKHGHTAAIERQDFTALWSEAVAAADTWSESAAGQVFLEYFRQWWTRRFSKMYPRTCLEPNLTGNARNRASIAYYNHIIKGQPMPDPCAEDKPETRPAVELASLGEVVEIRSMIEELAKKKVVQAGKMT